MNPLDAYPSKYEDARQRFRDAATQAGAILKRHSISAAGFEDGALTIDVATVGNPDPSRAVVVSSGVHGVVGFSGSAIQVAWLSQIVGSGTIPDGAAVILVHGINPYGFKMLRRTNEDNVDLNRNFLTSDSDYERSPNAYALLNGFLNPASPPSPFEPFRLKALWNIRRFGLPGLKNALAGGQHGFPQGLFFGGTGPAQSTRIIQDNLEEWIGAARDVVHVDLHTGLGKYGQ